MQETDQPFPSRNQFDRVPRSADGSSDLYFGPTKPEGVNERNWIQTLKGSAFLVCIRLYGARVRRRAFMLTLAGFFE